MRNSTEITQPDDLHVHLREDGVLRAVAPETARVFKRALVMPNRPYIGDAEAVREYRGQILETTTGFDFEPLMTMYLTSQTTPDRIVKAARAGAYAIKYYPKSREVGKPEATTGAAYGLTPEEFAENDDIFTAAAECGMRLCVHGEDPDFSLAYREREFLPYAKSVAHRFPKLTMIFEHVSDRAGVDFVKANPNVHATITAHHLVLTWADVVGNHDHLCMPVAKTDEDRMALLEAAMSGDPSFFFGSDSAPHPRLTKNRATGSFGIYSAPVALETLAETFEEHGHLGRLDDFVSKFGAEAYGLPRNTGRVELIREPWTVPDPVADRPDDLGVIRPFRAGETLNYKIAV